MKLCALILDDQLDSVKIAQTVLENRGIVCVSATNIADASRLLEEHLPHLLVVDISLGPNENGLDWLNSVRVGVFKDLPAIVLTSSGQATDVRKSISLGIDDYIIKPADPMLLRTKITDIQRRLQANRHYVFKANDSEPAIKARINVEMRINAVAETGLCLSSQIANRAPFDLDTFETTFFSEVGVPVPKRLTFLNHEREPNSRSRFPRRNFCQAKGWVETDFRQIRLWIRSQKLGRIF